MSSDAASSAAPVQPADDRATAAPFRQRRWIAPAAIVLAVLAVYGRTLQYDFVYWDDNIHLWENPHLSPPTTRGLAAIWGRAYHHVYIPVTYTFFAIESLVAGGAPSEQPWSPLDPRWFHAVSLALHAAVCLLVFRLLSLLVSDRVAAFAGAVLFAVHPLQVESVAWISEQRGLLAALFGTLALVLRLQDVLPAKSSTADERDARAADYAARLFPAGTVPLVLALLSKPAAAAVPMVAVAIECLWLRRGLRQVTAALASWFVLAGAMVVFTSLAQPADVIDYPTPWLQRPLVAGDALAFYLVKLVAPWGLAPDYGRTPPVVMSCGSVYAAWLVPTVVLAAAAFLPGRRAWLTSMAIFIVALAPVLGLVPFMYQNLSTVADRYVYLAMLGPALALAWIVHAQRRAFVVVATAAMVVALAIAAFGQSHHWRDTPALCIRALEQNPRSPAFLCNQGALELAAGHTDRAAERFALSIDANPRYAPAYANLGAVLLHTGDLTAALERLQQAANLEPGVARYHANLGTAYLRLERYDEAGRAFHEALRLDPTLPAAAEGLDRIHAHAAPAL